MIRKKRLGRNEHGEPVLTIEVVGAYDIYRFAHHLLGGQCEFSVIGRKSIEAMKRRIGEARYSDLDDYFEGRHPLTRGPVVPRVITAQPLKEYL